jgi:DNA-binding LacI/PurR family transcriptional regulator
LKRPTLNDVAKAAGVSLATVSYVVNNGPRPVSAETRIRVKEVISRLGYHPHGIARSLRRGSSNNIGLLVHSLIPSSSGYLVNEIEENLTRLGLNLILACSHEDCVRESKMLDMLSTQAIDGLLIIPTGCSNETQIRQLLSEDIPVVFVDRYIPGVPADIVATDNVQAGKDATEYLIQQGCKRILFFSFSNEASSAVERMDGYRLACKANTIAFDKTNFQIVNYEARETTDEKLFEFIQINEPPDGIVWASDHFVMDVSNRFIQMNYPIPKQICISGGILQSSWNRMFQLPMPVVDQNYRSIAASAVGLLHERIRGMKNPPLKKLIPADLFVGN